MVQEGLVEEDVVICCKLIVHHFKACLPTRRDAANHIPNEWILPNDKARELYNDLWAEAKPLR